VRGLWRVTTPADYDAGGTPHWKAVLDSTSSPATSTRTGSGNGHAECEPRHERRCLIALSDGGEDAVTVREFDLGRAAFVDKGFLLPKGKQRAAWVGCRHAARLARMEPGRAHGLGLPATSSSSATGPPLSEARRSSAARPPTAAMASSPHSLVDAAGRHALIIERPLSTFESEQYLVTRPACSASRCRQGAGEELYDGQLLVRVGPGVAGRRISRCARARSSRSTSRRRPAHPEALAPRRVTRRPRASPSRRPPARRHGSS
jgi:prolyl oligopeptidase